MKAPTSPSHDTRLRSRVAAATTSPHFPPSIVVAVMAALTILGAGVAPIACGGALFRFALRRPSGRTLAFASASSSSTAGNCAAYASSSSAATRRGRGRRGQAKVLHHSLKGAETDERDDADDRGGTGFGGNDRRCSASSPASCSPPSSSFLPSPSSSTSVLGIPHYGIAGVDLSEAWINLVEDGRVEATTSLPPLSSADSSSSEGVAMKAPSKKPMKVRYGVRISKRMVSGSGEVVRRCEEFAMQVDDKDDDGAGIRQGTVVEVHPLVASINATLESVHSDSLSSEGDDPSYDDDDHDDEGEGSTPPPSAVRCGTDSLGYSAQLQLVRTLRPPPSRGFDPGDNNDFRTSCDPPPYDPESDSFLVGDLRLENRPLVATLDLPSERKGSYSPSDGDGNSGGGALNTPWDVYHNVSPADSRGHYLLLPSLSVPSNNRDQSLTCEDCADLIRLTSTIEPPGSALVSFNSVGAGASQNHAHLHLWPSPPPSLLGEGTGGWDCYPASRAKVAVDEGGVEKSVVIVSPSAGDADSGVQGGWRGRASVRASLLDYPCFCVKISTVSGGGPDALTLAGNVLSAIVELVQRMGAPHNLGLLNLPPAAPGDDGDDDDAAGVDADAADVDAYLFVRSRERSPSVLPDHTLGGSEVMGMFHAHTSDQMDRLIFPTEEDDEEEGGYGGEADGSGNGSGTDAYLFVRSRERSPDVAPSSRIGSSDVMGAFQSSRGEQMEELLGGSGGGDGDGDKDDGALGVVGATDADIATATTPMYRALKDVSYEGGAEGLWDDILASLKQSFGQV